MSECLNSVCGTYVVGTEMASLTDKTEANEEFKRSWKHKFPDEELPVVTCFENKEGECTTDIQKQAYRHSLQVSLDQHSLRINSLQKELEQEQFVLEYIAKELESLPVPRLASSTTTPPITNFESKPTPRPRKPPAVPQKPFKSTVSEETSAPGYIRRNKSSPSARQIPSTSSTSNRPHFASVYNTNRDFIEETSSSIQNPAGKTTDDPSMSRKSDSMDDRFETFKGSTFSSSPRLANTEQNTGISGNGVSNPAAGSPAIIESSFSSGYEAIQINVPPASPASRNSMKQMNRISINDTDSDSSGSDHASDDYMQLWNTKPLMGKPRTSSSVSSEVSHLFTCGHMYYANICRVDVCS